MSNSDLFHIVEYGPGDYSHTRESINILEEVIRDKSESAEIDKLDLVENPAPILDRQRLNAYINRNYKDEEISDQDQKAIAIYDDMIERVIKADHLVIGFPIYNYAIPAGVKAWIDGIVQKDKAYEIGMYGTSGLLELKSVLIVESSGGTRIDSKKDFATPYLRYILEFMGIDKEKVKVTGFTGTRFYQDKSSQYAELENEFIDYVENVLS
jgi:FMN-dependent NADH-azoreductase